MASIRKEEPLAVSFSEAFVQRDQDVADLVNPRPPTRFVMIELPKEELEELQKGTKFRFQTHSSGATAFCTATKTYQLEFLENSNSQFVGFPVMKTPAKERKEQEGTKNSSIDSPDKATAKDGEKAEEKAEGPKPEWTCNLFGQVRGQFFLKPTNGDTTKLREILSHHKLDLASSAEQEERTASLSSSALAYDVAASDAEVKSMLNEGPYAEVNGSWKLMTQEFMNEVLDIALAAVTANEWDKSSVDIRDLLGAVQRELGESGERVVPTVDVLRKIMKSVVAVPKAEIDDSKAKDDKTAAKGNDAAAKTDGAKAKSDDSTAKTDATDKPAEEPKAPAVQDENKFALDVEKVQQFQALQLLHSRPANVRRRFNLSVPQPRPKKQKTTSTLVAGRDPPLQLSEFVEAYREASGREMSGKDLIKMLGQQVHHDELEDAVQALDVGALPQEPRARLKHLFGLQSHWRPEMLAELIKPTLIIGVKVDPWLAKWARQVFMELGDPEIKNQQRMLIRKFAGI